MATLADLGSYLATQCLRPTVGQRTLVRWYEGQAGMFRALAAGLAALGADVVAVERGAAWLRGVRADALGDDWLPGPESEWQLVVTASPLPDVHRPGGDAGCDAVTWNHAVRRGYENLGRRVAADARTVLVDWPTHARGGLSRADVRRTYARALAVDYAALEARNETLIERLGPGREVRVTCPLGSDLTLSIEGRPWRAESCHPGDGPVVYLPGGEVYSACVETSAQGVLFFDDGRRNGRATFRDGALVALVDSDWQELVGLHIGELGLGTNDRAPREQLGTVTEKAIGTAHFGVGTNTFLGGVVDEGTHVDLVVHHPRVWVDGRRVLVGGMA